VLQLNRLRPLALVLLGQLYLNTQYKALEEYIDNLISLDHKKGMAMLAKGDTIGAIKLNGAIGALQSLKNSVKLIHDKKLAGVKLTPESTEDFPDGIPIEV